MMTRLITGSLLLAFVLPVSARILFHDVTEEAGVDNTGETYGTAVGDINGDGCPDVWLDHHQYTPTETLVNRCDGTLSFDQYREEPDDSDGGGLLPAFEALTDTHGMAFADLNNDGSQDAIEVSGASWYDLVWVNDGTGHFTDQNRALGFIWPTDPIMCSSERRCRPVGRRAPLWFDYNKDGKLDIIMAARGDFVAYRQPTATFKQIENPDGSPFFQYDGSTGINYTSVDFCAYAVMAEVTGDSELDVICADDAGVAKIWDVSQIPFRVVGSDEIGSGLFDVSLFDLAIGDFDGDLRNEIFAPLRHSAPSVVDQVDSRTVHFVHKNGSGTDHAGFSFAAQGNITIEFDWRTLPSNIHIGANGSSPPWSTNAFVYNGNGNRVILTLSPTNPANIGQPTYTPGVTGGVFIWYDGARWQVRASNVASFNLDNVGMVVTAAQSISGLAGFESMTVGAPANRRPWLFAPNTSGQYVNASSRITGTPSSCVSAAAGDFDNDGHLDVVEVCSDALKNRPNRIYRNDGNGNLIEVTGAGADTALGFTGAVGQMPFGRSQAVVTADFDGDGRLDFLVANGHTFRPFSTAGRQQVFQNVSDSGNNWAQIDLEGVLSNRDAIGARLFVTTPDGRTQLREQAGGMHIHSQNFKRIHVGLARNEQFDVEIHWPNGDVETHSGLAANRFYNCVEGGNCTAATGGPTPTLSVSDPSVSEADGVAGFVVSLSTASDEEVSVSYTTADGTAVVGSDYTAVSGILTFAPGETTKPVEVAVLDDDVFEPTENFSLVLSDAVGAGLAKATGIGTVLDDDSAPISSCGEPTFAPGSEAGMFLWQDCATSQWHARVAAGGSPTALRFVGSVVSSEPFTNAAGVLLEPSSDVVDTSDPTRMTYRLNAVGSGIDGLAFSFPPGARVCFSLDEPAGVSTYIGSEKAPMPASFDLTTLGECGGGVPLAPEITVADVTVGEGDGVASFAVSLSSASAEPVSVNYATADGTATAGADYESASGVLTFAPGETARVVEVAVLDDAVPEATESFELVLSGAVGAVLQNAQATAAILDDDGFAGPACGAPVYNAATEAAVFLYYDCADPRQWRVRFTAGGVSGSYRGTLSSDAPFESLAGVSQEATDVLNPAPFATPTAGPINYVQNVGGNGFDGFEFRLAAGARACFNLTAPAGRPVWIGSDRVAASVPVDPTTLQVCTP
jgi:hypothetical protein